MVKKNIPIFVSQAGCPFKCVFCNQKSISGADLNLSANEIVSLIDNALSTITASPCNIEIAYFGGSFSGLDIPMQETLLSIAQRYIKENKAGGIRLSTRPDLIHKAVMERFLYYGVTTVELGAQSMEDSVLKASFRGHTAEDTVNASILIKSYGFSLILQMMTGLPGDSREKTLSTARQIISLKPDGVRIYPVAVLKNTKLCNMMEKGDYVPLSIEEAVYRCSLLLPMFYENRIPVLRVGLMASEGLNSGDVAAGAYHPSLGELAASRVYLDRARKLLSNDYSGKTVTLYVKTGQVSKMTGNKGFNKTALLNEFNLKTLKIKESKELPMWEVIAEINSN